MAVCERLRNLFEKEHATYWPLPHPEAFTSAEKAAVSHIPGSALAKVVVLRDEHGRLLMAVIPAPTWVDLRAMTRAIGRQGLCLAAKEEFGALFPDCEAEAMPPFGHLYGLPLYVDPCLARVPRIAFQAGNHRELVAMNFLDYERLAQPIVGRTCLHGLRLPAAG